MKVSKSILILSLVFTFFSHSNHCLAKKIDPSLGPKIIGVFDRSDISLDDLLLVSIKKAAFKPDEDLQPFFVSKGVESIGVIGKDDMRLYEVLCKHGEVDSKLEALKNSPQVNRVLRNIRFPPASGPTITDPDYQKQYHLQSINAPEAWNNEQSGQHVPIAILDSGCNNDDLSGHMYSGYDAVLHIKDAGTNDVTGHGTMVATTAAAIAGNFKGGLGVAYSSMIVPVRIADSSGYASLSTITKAIQWCGEWNGGPFHEPLKIINISYSNLTANGPDHEHEELHRWFKWFHDTKGGLIFVAAGNDSIHDKSAMQPYLIVVSANRNGDPGRLAPFSNYGSCIKFNAPGTSIFCTDRTNQTVSPDGTSLASPIVAAMAANLWTKRLASNIKIEELLRKMSVRPNGKINNGLEWDEQFGFGMPVYKSNQQTLPPVDNGPDTHGPSAGH